MTFFRSSQSNAALQADPYHEVKVAPSAAIVGDSTEQAQLVISKIQQFREVTIEIGYRTWSISIRDTSNKFIDSDYSYSEWETALAEVSQLYNITAVEWCLSYLTPHLRLKTLYENSLAPHVANLTSLDITIPYYDENNLEFFVNLIANNTRLRHLGFHNHDIEYSAAKKIKFALTKNTTLNSFALPNCKMSLVAFRSIVKAFKLHRNKTITTLNLANTMRYYESSYRFDPYYIGILLDHRNALTSINLADNLMFLKKYQWRNFLKLFPLKTNLVAFDFSNNCSWERDVMKTLVSHKTLRSLGLGRYTGNITEVAENLSNSIEILDLEGNHYLPAQEDGFDMLRQNYSLLAVNLSPYIVSSKIKDTIFDICQRNQSARDFVMARIGLVSIVLACKKENSFKKWPIAASHLLNHILGFFITDEHRQVLNKTPKFKSTVLHKIGFYRPAEKDINVWKEDEKSFCLSGNKEPRQVLPYR